jgi:group II intron reverse transcriptase/maturase
MYENLRWIIDADIMQYFDTIKHELLKDVVKQRVEDGRIVRLIGKWLNAGIMDGKKLSYPETGTPQGGVISPLLANIYLDQVLDAWFEDVVPHYLRGRVRLIRFADDFVIGCEYEEDAHRVMAVLHKRLEKYGLKIHPDKTRLVDMRIPTKGKKGNTFNFLGFTFYWARSRRGYWVIKKRTMAKRKQRAIKRNWLWCKRNRHESVKHQHKRLSQKLQGYYNYFGVIGNYGAIMAVYHWTKMAWKYWLGRRGGKRRLTWERFEAILVTFPLPTPRIVHNI